VTAKDTFFKSQDKAYFILSISIHALRNGFKQLPPEDKEECFALSCYDLGDWEEGFDWLSNLDDVRENIDEYLSKLTPDPLWAQIRANRSKLSTAQDFFLTGEASNHFLAWYLESEFDRVQGHTESRSSQSQFDVRLSVEEVDVVGIEMKRVANSGQLTNYLRKFPKLCAKRTDTTYKILIMYYPVGMEAAHRAPSLVRGYGPLSAMTNGFYEPEEIFVGNIPATYPRQGGEVRPLRETKDILQHRLGAIT
jgi:hypothetical protein